MQQVLAHFPPEAFYALSAMSDRALAYSEEPLKNRMLVLYEAAGMSGDFASYLVRSLLSEGCVRYETVERTIKGLRPRLIEREGPTGLITTTTAVSLHPENETRLLSISVTDTPEQTRMILCKLSAGGVAGNPPANTLAPWRALQQWLATTELRIIVPFAGILAEQIPPLAIRLRRDFSAILVLIKAHAALHQASRKRDSEGRIIATLTDYGVVRALVVDVLGATVHASVSDTVRETVEAVTALDRCSSGVSLRAVAKRLGLDKGTVSRRVRVAVKEGYLKNLQTNRGQPMQLTTADPLPETVSLLPDPSRLTSSCGVADPQEDVHTPPPPSSQGQCATDAELF